MTQEAIKLQERASSRRRGRSLRLPSWVWTALIAVAALILAQVAAAKHWVSAYILAKPTEIVTTFFDGFSRESYWQGLWSTLAGTLIGFVVAAVLGIGIAGILSSIPSLERVMMPFVYALQTIPKVAIAPLVVLWLGFGQESKIFLIAFVAFFPILVNSLQGLRIRDRDQYDVFQCFGASSLQLFWKLRFPAALPYIFAGLHVSIIFSLIGAIVAEFVGSQAGLGVLLLHEQAAYNIPGFYAILLILIILGAVLHGLMVLLERRVTFWAKDISVASL